MTLFKNRIFSASLLISFLFTIDKLVALYRQSFVGRAYGIGAALDAYNSANNLPDLIYAVISGGALGLAFIPILTETLDKEGREAMWSLFSRVANFGFIVTASLALTLVIFADPLIRNVVVPGFPIQQQDLTIQLMRLNVIALMIFSLSGLVIGVLQANQHFFLPALAPIMYNVGQIVGVVFLAPRFGIFGLAYGVILGAALHLLIQVPGLIRHGFKWSPSLEWRHPRVIQVAQLMLPRILTILAVQSIFVLTDNFASHLYEGAITAIAYGWLIMQMPETIIGTAIGTAIFPTLSELVSRDDRAGLRSTLRRSLIVLVALIVPITIVSLILVRPAVQFVFEGRAFTAAGTTLVVASAQMFLLGMLGHSLLEVVVRMYYALHDAITPLIAAALTAASFALLCYLLVPLMGHTAIGLANTIAFSGEAAGLIWILHRRKVL